jgi:folate-binding protein YgfZ
MTNSSFGNPLVQQRSLLKGLAFVELEDQAVLELDGPDAKSWLHSLTSQNILNLETGESTESLLLDPQGHVEQQLKVIAIEAGLLLILPKSKLEDFQAWLQKMKFRTKVEIINRSDLRVIGSFAPLEQALYSWVDQFSAGSPGGVRYAESARVFDYQEHLVGLDQRINLEPASPMALEGLRIAAGRPAINDIDERALPHEFDWLASAVHMSKGCYRGQESVAKIHNIGHPPRRLIILNLEEGDILSQQGDEVFYQDKLVGKVRAAALHYEAGSVALALVNRNTPYLDLMVQTASGRYAATQEVLVPFDAGKAANLPRPSAFKLSGKK